MVSMTTTVDQAAFRKVEKNLGPELYREALGHALTDATHLGEGVVKGATPVKTGNLRRSGRSDTSKVNDERDPEGRVVSDARYANWIETGEYESRPAKMNDPAGGYRMFEQGQKAAEAALPRFLDQAAREIEERFSE